MRRAGIKPVPLGPKDGIALVSANAASLGTGALVLHDAAVVLQAQRAALALSLEGFRGNLDPFDPRLAKVRAAPGQAEAAAAVLKLLKGGALMKPGAARRVQDPLSFRCFPSVHGAAMAALASAMLVLEQELNSGGDNPAVVDGDMIMTGNFDITALVLEFERLGQALAQTAILSAQRIAKMQSQSLTDLPRFLSPARRDACRGRGPRQGVVRAGGRHPPPGAPLLAAGAADRRRGRGLRDHGAARGGEDPRHRGQARDHRGDGADGGGAGGGSAQGGEARRWDTARVRLGARVVEVRGRGPLAERGGRSGGGGGAERRAVRCSYLHLVIPAC